jgi:dihydroxyacetone kinase-like predicted kinase
MVKMNSKDATMVLEKVVTDAKDMITGTPQQMPSFGGMGGAMGGMQQPPQH